MLSTGGFAEKYGALFMTPAETRALFTSLGWSTIAAFQTRNPMHRSHEYLAKVAIEVCDGVLIHSLLGALKPGDIPAEVRTQAIAVLAENYFVQKTVVQAGYPLDMRYAGPREALLHALFRQNYGCSHLIVGRDHAGVGSYYGPFDAHHIFDQIPKGALRDRSRSRSTGRSGATAAAAWPPAAPARTPTPTGCWCPAPSCASGCPRAPTCRPNSAGPRCSRSCASTTRRSTPKTSRSRRPRRGSTGGAPMRLSGPDKFPAARLGACALAWDRHGAEFSLRELRRSCPPVRDWIRSFG